MWGHRNQCLNGRRRPLLLLPTFELLTVSVLLWSGCHGSGPTSSPSVTPRVNAQAPASCRYTIVPEQVNQTVDASGGSVTIAITANSGCRWTAASNADFITITDNGGGDGNGVVAAAVAANTGGERRGTLTIAGETFTVTQRAASCTFALSGDTNQSFPAAGGMGAIVINVTRGTNCDWTATSNASFIVITSGASGSGDGTVLFRVAANSSTEARSGSLTVAGQTIPVRQAANEPCTYTVNPATASFTSRGGSGSFTVTARTGCDWTAVSDSSWLSLSSGASGNGTGTVSYVVNVNGGRARSGRVGVRGSPFTAAQSRNRCDVNNDDVINAVDADIVRQAILMGSTNPDYDLNGDGQVNVQDAQIVANAISDPGSCPTQEPGPSIVPK